MKFTPENLADLERLIARYERRAKSKARRSQGDALVPREHLEVLTVLARGALNWLKRPPPRLGGDE